MFFQYYVVAGRSRAGTIRLLALAPLAVTTTVAVHTVVARAADITFLCAGALETTVEEVVSEFQKATGHNVKAEFAAIGVTERRLLGIMGPR